MNVIVAARYPHEIFRYSAERGSSFTMVEGQEWLWQSDPTKFHTDFVAVALDGAEWLIAHGIKLVGVDYLSVEQYNAPFEHPVHKNLLSNQVVIVGGLNLSAVEPGEYTLMALPLKIAGNDGAPARVLLGK